MKIGLTFDLKNDYAKTGLAPEQIAELDSEETILALEDALRSLGHEVERVGHIFALARGLTANKTWDLVFNICEGMGGRSREAQVPALLEAFGIPYAFSDPLTLAVTLDKAIAKCLVRDAGLATPSFFTAEPGSAPSIPRDMKFPLFVKPLYEGTGKGISAASVVRDPDELAAQCRRLQAEYSQAVLVESYLSGREFTVGILGTGAQARALGVLEVRLKRAEDQGVYSYQSKAHWPDHVEYKLVRDEPQIIHEAETLSLAAYRVLGCRDAGRVDLRAGSDGRLYFLEVNPLAGLNPRDSDLPILCTQLGIPYAQLIRQILDSAMLRPAGPSRKLAETLLAP